MTSLTDQNRQTIEEPDFPPLADIREDMGCIVSIDVGQRQDYSAIAVLQRFATTRYTRAGATVSAEARELALDGRVGSASRIDAELGLTKHRITSYDLIDITRLPLGTPFPEVVDHVRAKMYHPALRGRPATRRRPARPEPVLALDATGGIGGLKDAFKAAGLPGGRRFWAITIHGGNATSFGDGYHRVPKRDLARLVGILLETPLNRGRRLGFARGLPLLDVLIGELQNFRVKINIATGHEAFEAWRERDHDDMVLAVAMGCWVGERLEREPQGEFVRAFPHT